MKTIISCTIFLLFITNIYSQNYIVLNRIPKDTIIFTKDHFRLKEGEKVDYILYGDSILRQGKLEHINDSSLTINGKIFLPKDLGMIAFRTTGQKIRMGISIPMFGAASYLFGYAFVLGQQESGNSWNGVAEILAIGVGSEFLAVSAIIFPYHKKRFYLNKNKSPRRRYWVIKFMHK